MLISGSFFNSTWGVKIASFRGKLKSSYSENGIKTTPLQYNSKFTSLRVNLTPLKLYTDGVEISE